MLHKSLIPTLVLLATVLFSCKNPIPENTGTGTDEPGYFSVKQFIRDQWDTYRGQPFGLVKKVYVNGKEDSSMISAYDMDWAAVFKPFFESDIGDAKYIGRYTFSSFADDATMTQNFFYEANDEDLFTRKLQVSADDVTHKIRSIYVETARNNKWSKFSQKLFYMPLKVISIQEFEWSDSGPSKEMRVEYRFL